MIYKKKLQVTVLRNTNISTSLGSICLDTLCFFFHFCTKTNCGFSITNTRANWIYLFFTFSSASWVFKSPVNAFAQSSQVECVVWSLCGHFTRILGMASHSYLSRWFSPRWRSTSYNIYACLLILWFVDDFWKLAMGRR